jgi:hypothetical protein
MSPTNIVEMTSEMLGYECSDWRGAWRVTFRPIDSKQQLKHTDFSRKETKKTNALL